MESAVVVESTSEHEVWAEHRAALDATVFAAGERSEIVLVLEDGELVSASAPPRARRQSWKTGLDQASPPSSCTTRR